MAFLETFIADVIFRLRTFTALNLVDLGLVTMLFFAILSFVRRSQAGVLLRGVLILIVLLLVTTLVLPLPTLTWIILGLMIALLIATPLTLQNELRRWLEQIGRNPVLSRLARRSTAEKVLIPIRRAVRDLAATHTGALIVLEGEDPLDEIIESGIAINGELTSELLLTLFFDKTPLHDGAVVLRGEQVVAAGCVLPLTQQEPEGAERRYGTRHRAALGLSEASDAFVVVVSEETGQIALAQRGELLRNVDEATLRQQVADFYVGVSRKRPFAKQQRTWQQRLLAFLKALFTNIFYAIFALIFALLAWAAVIERTNPTETRSFVVPLRVAELAEGMSLTAQPPATVTVAVKSTADLLQTLQAESFQATLSLAEAETGLQRLPVAVTTVTDQLQILSVTPAEIDVETAVIISRTLPLAANVLGADQTSLVYEIVGLPMVNPQEATVQGPAPLVAQVQQLQVAVSAANATATIRQAVAIEAVDGNGRLIEGLLIEPAQAQVTLQVRRRLDVREAGVRAVTTGTPAEGYWLSGLSVQPSSVLLQGDAEVLATMTSFVNTLPIDVSVAYGDVTVAIPLDLPPGIQSFDAQGNPLGQVTVLAQISAREGDLLLERPFTLVPASPEDGRVPEQDTITLLLRGPLPVLREIEINPDLVQVTLDLRQWPTGDDVEAIPAVAVPEDVSYQIIDGPILIQR